MAPPVNIRQLVPGGILDTDFVHRKTNDNTCSRCRKPISDDEVPLMLWGGERGADMLIYCEACLDRGGK